MKTTEISVYCWHCGKGINIEISNVVAGHLFCSDEHRIANLEQEKNIVDFNGTIDGCNIFNRALSHKEIMERYYKWNNKGGEKSDDN